jgi:hypothetical protein
MTLQLCGLNTTQNYDFGSQKTFFMPDSMIFLTNIDGDNISEESVRAYEETLLNAIQENMELRGYTLEETDTNNIDLVVIPSAVLARNSGAVWYPGYWGGYYPGFGWGWGGGWYYPPGYGVVIGQHTPIQPVQY